MTIKNVPLREKSIGEELGFSEVQIIYKRKSSTTRKVVSSQTAFDLLKRAYPSDRMDYKEFFYVMLLNRKNEVLGVSCIGEGATSGVVVNKKEVFQLMLRANASAVILSHNHPSGNLKPSMNDIELTKKLVEFSKLIDVQILDHLILTSESYFSFADEGMIG